MTYKKEVSANQGGQKYTEKLIAYELTLEGRKNLKRALGQSRVAHVPKRIFNENLLYLAEELKSGRMPYPESFSLFQNEEIQISQKS